MWHHWWSGTVGVGVCVGGGVVCVGGGVYVCTKYAGDLLVCMYLFYMKKLIGALATRHAPMRKKHLLLFW